VPPRLVLRESTAVVPETHLTVRLPKD
jgi:hypothetical protein